MDRRTETYLGHTIDADAEEDRPGRWGWSYLIDGRISSVSKIRLLPDAEAALRQALAAARARVDEMER
jgi:hypothetical protein